jgi:hypothetical protein
MTAMDPISLRSQRLEVEISAPGAAYHGTRFDWSAFITQVSLDGRHNFCVPESYQPGEGTGGIGLCNEFGIDRAVGYDEAKAGEFFPKLGVGLLLRHDQSAYDFFYPYEIVQRFPVWVESGPDWARFTVEPLECRGYAARLVKTVRLQDNRLEIAYHLANVGQKALLTNEYVHNFNGIDCQLLGPDYRLRFPYRVEIEQGTARGLEVVDFQGKEVHIRRTPSQAFYFRTRGFSQSVAPQWELKLPASGVGLCEIDDFAPVRVGVWGTSHVISVEIFAEVSVQPGQVQQWVRRYEFNDKESANHK